MSSERLGSQILFRMESPGKKFGRRRFSVVFLNMSVMPRVIRWAFASLLW